MLSIDFGNDVVQRLGDVRQPVNLDLLAVQSVYQPSVVVSHLRQLGCDLSRQLYAVLQRRVGF